MAKFGKSLILFLLLITIFTSCHRRGLRVQHRFLSYKEFASEPIRSPDYRRDSPPLGERLVIFHNIDRGLYFEKEPTIELSIRYRQNIEDEHFTIPIDQPSGYRIFDLVDRRFDETGGISSYRVQIVADGEILDEWRHQVWAERIIL